MLRFNSHRWKIVAAIVGIEPDEPVEMILAPTWNINKSTPYHSIERTKILSYDILSDEFTNVMLTIEELDTKINEGSKKLVFNEYDAKKRIKEHLDYLLVQVKMRDKNKV